MTKRKNKTEQIAALEQEIGTLLAFIKDCPCPCYKCSGRNGPAKVMTCTKEAALNRKLLAYIPESEVQRRVEAIRNANKNYRIR